MFGFIASRILQAIPVLLVVGFLAFALFTYVGDPIAIMLPQDHTEAQRLQLIHDLGLDQPFIVQYWHFLLNALHGNFGNSYRMAQPVLTLIGERLPATLELAVTATILAFAIGVPMGVYTGINRTGWLSRLFMIVSLIGVSLPTFLLGILLILCFAVWLGWLPSFGRGTVSHIGGWWTTGFTSWSGIRSLILPAITLGMFQMTLIMRLVRAEMLEVLRADYIKFARARGLTNRSIYFGHALKNTLVPVITVIGLQFGGIVAFSLVTETVFQWPGMGLLLVQSVSSADIPVMSAYLLLIALVFVIINLIVDLLYYAVDPRLRVRR
ncbi:ABC transporter permease [Rhodopila sp.]|jgi:peptide/nickel transport system permease protein|uniref:ABC transporter permease n=1 Tax=Rhodopila sp. TaxID=2480087 RepID=UPI002D08672B|nr:ABC transporter permease [Rhodopila sp.]HVZ07450.1 ABC transporter permease [Rhodopila sp.]